MAKTFAAQVKGFADMTAKNMRYVAVNAIQDVMEAAQTPQVSVKRTGGAFEVGKIPVDASELIQSLVSGINGSAGAVGPQSYVVAIGGYAIGDYMRFEWTAPHALPMEAGFTTKSGTRVPGRHYVGFNAARFSEFVDARVKEVQQ